MKKKKRIIYSAQELANGLHMQYLALRELAGDDITREVLMAIILDLEKDNPEMSKQVEEDLKTIRESFH